MKYTLIVLLSAYAFAGSVSLDKEIKISSSSKEWKYTPLYSEGHAMKPKRFCNPGGLNLNHIW